MSMSVSRFERLQYISHEGSAHLMSNANLLALCKAFEPKMLKIDVAHSAFGLAMDRKSMEMHSMYKIK